MKFFYTYILKRKKFIFISMLIVVGFSALLPPVQNFTKSLLSSNSNSDLDELLKSKKVINLKENKSIEVYKTIKEDITESLEFLGQISFYEKVNISSKVTGRLEKIYIQEGKRVRKGELLAEVERLPLELNLKQQLAEKKITIKSYELTKAKYENALKAITIKLKTIEKAKVDVYDKKIAFLNVDRVYKNKQKLYEIGGISTTDLESIKTQHSSMYTQYLQSKSDLEIQSIGYRDEDIISEGYKLPDSKSKKMELIKKINTKIERAELSAAKTKIEQVNKSLESTRIMIRETYIRSPITGIIASKSMEAGEMIKNDSTIGIVMDISRVYLTFNVNEKDINSVKKKQRVTFTVDAMENTSFEGKTSTISPVLDPKTRTIQVKAVVKNRERKLLPGMFARAKLALDTKKNRILIPQSAIVKKDKGMGEIYIVKKGIIFNQKVKLGKEYDSRIDTLGGLAESDMIISRGVNLVYPGLEIKM